MILTCDRTPEGQTCQVVRFTGPDSVPALLAFGAVVEFWPSMGRWVFLHDEGARLFLEEGDAVVAGIDGDRYLIRSKKFDRLWKERL